MKKLILILLLFATSNAFSQNFAPLDKSIMDVAYYPKGAHGVYMTNTPADKAKLMPKIKITYSRPQASGRKIFGELLKYGESWRFGANESTEVVFYTAVRIGDSILSPGRYTLYCTPNEDKWTLHVHPNVDGWGIYAFDESKELASITTTVNKAPEFIEAFSISLFEASPKIIHLKAGWENTVVEFPIELL